MGEVDGVVSKEGEEMKYITVEEIKDLGKTLEKHLELKKWAPSLPPIWKPLKELGKKK